MNETPESPAKIKQYRQLAKAVVRKHFVQEAKRIAYRRSGLTNYVFVVNHVEGQFVIRISPEREKLEVFKKEHWVTREARSHGVPTPEVLVVGDDIGRPYVISRRVTGLEATHHEKRQRIIHKMGEYASVINSIHTNNFGKSFDWKGEPREAVSWSDYLDYEWKIEDRLEILERSRLLKTEDLIRLRSILNEAKSIKNTPSLNHGDLRLKNVIVDDDGEVAAIIDWDDALSALAPAWEVSIALHDLSIDEKDLFIAGYGLTVRQIEEIAPLLKAFNIMNYAYAVDHAIKSNNEKAIAQFKLRLSGSLDLYTLRQL